ncbi:MAG: XRE family transcriptional regulator [Alistipes sp.]|nr:XRE family transcriptional regulator [Alistipes sp.]
MRTEIDWQIIQNVKRRRKELNISQRKLAIIIGTNYSFVWKVENEKYDCKYSAYQLYLIAEDFDWEVSDLFPPVNKR